VSRVRRGLPRFNRLPDDEARAELATCLDVPRWTDEVAAGRPYDSIVELEDVASRSAGSLTDDELESALARHPRIGERAGAGHDAEHSASEQSGVDRRDAEVLRRLEEGNRAYEERFDRVFLIRASGRDASAILGELDRRLRNDDVTERAETVEQLRQIAINRLNDLVR
jgi:2-oxo-4-hydroxy-4-carboxy-5-ureidoimidazoline decarboxylase